ncbi:MAG: hypothetical protein U0228_15300 [Myxococcaceae bacterium]
MRLVEAPPAAGVTGPFTDVQRAREASTFMVGVFAAQLAMTVLSRIIAWLVPSSWDGPWPIAEELLWLALSVATIVAVLRLGGALVDRSLALITAGVWVVMAIFDVAGAFIFHLERTASFIPGVVSKLVTDLQFLVTLGARALLFVLFSKLTMQTRAWVMPLLGVAWLLSAARFAMVIAITHGLAGPDLYRDPLWRYGGLFSAFFGTVVTLAAAWAVRAVAFESTSGAQAVPPREVGNHAPPLDETASPTGDFVFGAILLLVGIGVTMVSMSAASNGGRYLVATGAIGTGIGRLIRGFIRLSRSRG